MLIRKRSGTLTAALELLDGLPEDGPHLRKRWEVVDHLRQAYADRREYERAREVVQDYLALAERAGYPWGMAAAHGHVADWESDRRVRMEHFEKSLQIAEEHGLADWQARARVALARTLTDAESDWPRAEALLRQTLQAPEGVPTDLLQYTYSELLLVCAWQRKWEAVAEALRQSTQVGVSDVAAGCLGVMEEALHRAGKQPEFVAFCEEVRALYVQAGRQLALNQWYLELAAPSGEPRRLLFRDDFDAPELRPEWQWRDPIRASSYNLLERPGHLTLRPGPGVDLWPGNNLNAPRLLVEVRGDFALEAKMPGDWVQDCWVGGRWVPGTFGISGLLVWKDALNWVRFDKCGLGYAHRGDMHFSAGWLGWPRSSAAGS